MNPATPEELQEIVAAAVAERAPLEVVGGGTKRGYGRPVSAERTLAVTGFTGIVDYQPQELICVVRPATPLAELESQLAERGQMLAFEPPHWGEAATVGGVVACNLAGPRRIKSGAARDHLLGFTAVTGRAEVVRGGGRVVKNVTGYDLSKLMCGSFGTLAVFTELVLKVLPLPETERTVVVAGNDLEEAVRLMVEAARSPHDLSALAHLPPDARRSEPLGNVAPDGQALTLLRVEGPAGSATMRAEKLSQMGGGAAAILEPADSRRVWEAVKELEPLPLDEGERLWRVSVPPAEGARTGAALEPLGGRRLYDWGGGLIWLALPGDAAASRVHDVAREAGGHARLVRSRAEPDEALAAFTPPSPGILRLNANLKQAFDPEGVLNPGRMYPDQ